MFYKYLYVKFYQYIISANYRNFREILSLCLWPFTFLQHLLTGRYTSPSKEAGLVIYLAFLAKVPNLYYMILTAFKKYWSDTVAKITSGTQGRFI